MKKHRIIGALAFVVGAWAATSPAAGQSSPDTVLLVVRHGEAYSNLPNLPDMPREKLDSLTPKGVADATAAGGVSKRHPVATVVASPTGRTRETAAIIAREVGLVGGTAEDAAFASVKMGTMPDGKTSTWDWRFAEWKAERDPRPAGGESLEDATARAVRTVQSLAARHPGKAIVIVTHSDIVAALIGHAVGTPIGQRYEKHGVPIGSVSEISISGDGVWKLVRQGGRPGS